ncbi:hypothetical protein [Deinococcus multiflagellatus]|uniref:Uncharacterized protein n=1 Tax=Deinococcus multiflagellatus TaxID=1656887 RepID=A0ABW1ZQ59_9DEIO|nr:hypothetical protein [Deinococcus multiflagellatus]MBZ9714926.1 hypothetical protein [Deinococcus multiflagellatus]
MARRSPFPATGAFFTLTHGSQVHLNPETHTWTPEWLGVADERDLIPYRTLQAALEALPVPLEQGQVAQAITALEGCQLRWVAPPKIKPTTLPPPLPRPAAPPYGSLTGYLRGTPEARQAIRTALGVRTHPAPAPMLAPPQGANPGLVGMAFDYAFRFLLEGLHPGLVAVKGGLIARQAALDLEHDRTRAAVDEAAMTLQEVAYGLPFEARHAHAAVVLASYEVVVRTGLFTDLAGVVPREARQDVLALIRAVPRELFQAQTQLILNPRFPAASRFGGADADVLLDDLLIEVKATRHLQLDGAYLQQLTGYLVLDRLGGTVGSALPIRRLGVYYARHGVLQILLVKDLYRPGLLPQLVSWFDESLPRG